MTPLAVNEARAIAQARLMDLGARIRVELAIDEPATREESWCRVFSYNSRAYLQAGSFGDARAGNGPIVVEKDGGAWHKLVTARPFDQQLEELRNRHR
jgi:hypothetical protein